MKIVAESMKTNTIFHMEMAILIALLTGVIIGMEVGRVIGDMRIMPLLFVKLNAFEGFEGGTFTFSISRNDNYAKKMQK